ncbi:hypothetical protein [Kordia sp.]|uniref:hypothetical protein n=1 Tax=Kordia sp. TaxID=1965332 RepID=UPI003B5990A4
MRYTNYLFLLLLVCFGCKNNTNTSTKEKSISATEKAANLTYLDSIQIIQTEKPFRVPQYHVHGKLITQKEFQELQLNKTSLTYNPKQEYRLLASLNPTANVKTLLLGITDTVNFGTTYIVTYNKNNEIVGLMLTDSHGKKGGSTTRTYMSGNVLYIEDDSLNTTIEYIIRKNGIIQPSNRAVTFKHYRYLGEFQGNLSQMPQQTVKAQNGLIIRDSVGKPIGKLPFGKTAYIIDYTKDSITIKDEGKTIKAPKARIILDPTKVTQGKDFYIEPSNIGYVFAGFLYDFYENAKDENSLYAYEYLKLGTTPDDEHANIDLREIFDIKRVHYNTYKSKAQKSFKTPTIDTTYKKGKILTLPFENGKKLILKDSTYKTEYNPTRSFNVVFHKDFPDSYLVSERMFFMNELYTILNKKTGDTIQQFTGYPYISPSKKYSVAVFNEFECMQQTFIVINKLKDGRYQNYASLQTNSWSYPYKLDKNNMMIDAFSIHWISDTEFIVYAKNPEECDMTNPTDYFYLKYRIK